jgi:predicted RNase H-like HicB family nuclease
MATTHQVTVFFYPDKPFSKKDIANYEKLEYCVECFEDHIFFDLNDAKDTAINKLVTNFKNLSGLDNPNIHYNIYQEAPENTWALIDSDEFCEAFANHFNNSYDIIFSDEFYVRGATREEAKDKLKQAKAFVKEYKKNQKHNKLLKRLEQYA